MMKLSTNAANEVRKFLASLPVNHDIVPSFNFARAVRTESAIGIAVRRDASTGELTSLASESWQRSMDDSWTLELVGYALGQVESSDIHVLGELPIYLPADLAGFFSTKTIDFQDGNFILLAN